MFTVIPPGTPQGKPPAKFILRRDNWNDYSFQTQYQLYQITDSAPKFIGNVKILKRGQTAGDSHQLALGPLQSLDRNFCSIGQSLDYYERIAALPYELREALLQALRDVVRYPDYAEDFRSEPGWGTSLFRYITESDDFILTARALLSRDYSAFPAIDVDFSFLPTEWDTPFRFRFDAPGDDEEDTWDRRARRRRGSSQIPARIAVIIGRNGSGKSTLLSRLARVAHASTLDRAGKHLQEIGQLEPTGIGFTRILTITYSAFDSFEVPGVSLEEREQISKDIDEGVGRYIFCGLRDIAQELRDEIDASEYQMSTSDRRRQTLLKPIEKIAAEFQRTLELIEAKDRNELLDSALKPISTDPSFAGILDSGFPTPRNAVDFFLNLSTGHKITLHVITSLVAHTEAKTLVLFDEPETHLHPSLLASLLHAIRRVLEHQDALAIVATHSPIVLQETLDRHIHVVRREGTINTIIPPHIQTFGENIGIINSEIFSLTSETTDFHSVLKAASEQYASIEEVEELFGERGLSMQARAYLMTLFAMKA